MKVNRKTQRGIRVMVFALALLLVLSAVPIGVYLTAPKSDALMGLLAEDWSSFVTAFTHASPSNELSVRLTRNITNTYSTTADNHITIRAGSKVTVNTDGHNITSSCTSGWDHFDATIFDVQPGAELTFTGGGTIEVNLNVTGMGIGSGHHQISVSRMSIVKNNGGTVNLENATLRCNNQLGFNANSVDGSNAAGHIFTWTTAVWNATPESVTNIKGGTIDIDAYGLAIGTNDKFGHMNQDGYSGGIRLFEFSYGVYGGKVNMNGGTINVDNTAYYHSKNSQNSYKRAVVSGVTAYGIMSEDIHFVNGNINEIKNTLTSNSCSGENCCAGGDSLEGAMTAWAAGLAYTTTPPVVDGGHINAPSTVQGSPGVGVFDNANKLNKVSYAIMKTPANYVSYDPASYDTLCSGLGGNHFLSISDGVFPLNMVKQEHRWKECESGKSNQNDNFRNAGLDFCGTPTAGSATDSNGRTSIPTSGADLTSYGTGANGNLAKNMYVYRYFHADNTVEISYTPKTEIAPAVTISSVTDNTGTTMTSAGTYLKYQGGGQTTDYYKWELHHILVRPFTANFSAHIDIDTWLQQKLEPSGDVFNVFTPTYSGPEHTPNYDVGDQQWQASNNSYSHLFVFIDYYENATEQLRFEWPEGYVPSYGNLGFKIYGTRNTDVTTDDDLLYDAAHPETNYLGEGKLTLAWETEDGSSSGTGMPLLVGKYKITVHVAANDATNRAGLEQELPALYEVLPLTSVTFDDLRTTLTYPKTLGDVDLTQLQPLGGLPHEIVDDFEYEWLDGYSDSTVLNASDAPQYFRLEATVKEEASDRYVLQSKPVIDVYIDVKPLDVVVSFADTEITYGDPIDEIYKDITFSANVERQEDKDAVIEIIKSHGGLAVATDSGDVPYTPGDILANEDGYDLVFPGGTGIVSGNYSISAAKGGHLTVAKRALTVAVNIPGPIVYSPGVTGQTVEIAAGDVSGVLDIDAYGSTIYVQSIYVNYPNGGNATPAAPLTGPSAGELVLQGAKWNCYYVSEVVYGNLEITQATPVEGVDYNIPTLPTDVIYDPLVTIGDLLSREDFQAALSAACLKDGEFTVVNEKEIPNAGTSAYVFTYTPTDKNYSAVEGIQVPLTVAKREIKVSVKHVELRYGDNAPDPSTFEWTFDNWTSVDTTGKDFIPPFRSENGMIVYNTGYTKESLGVYRDELNYYLSCDYDASETAPAAGSVFQVVESVDGTSIADLVANNYTFTFTPGTLAVYPKDLHIAMPDVHVAYNSLPTDPTVFDLTVTEDDLVGNDTLAGMISEGNHLLHFQYTDADGKAYEPGVDAGTPGYKVDMHIDPALKNYNLVIEEGKLIIDPMEITIRPKDMIVEYGDTVDLSAAGFESDPYVEDLSTVFTGNIKVDTDYDSSRPETSGVGEYHIRILEDQDIEVNKNYKVIFGDYNATLTITQGRLTADGFNHELTFQYDAALTLGDQLLAQEGKNRVALHHGDREVWGTLTYVNSTEFLTVTGSPYTMSMTFVPDDPNYANVSDLSGKVTVEPAELTGILQIYGSLVKGETLTPGLVGLNLTYPDSFRFEWFLVEADGSETSISTEPSLVILDEYVGKQLKLVATVDTQVEANYYGSDFCLTPVISADVYKIETRYITMVGGGETVYSGEPQTVAVKLIPGMESYYSEKLITVRYNGSTEAPTDVGTYYITADCAGNDTFAATDGLSIGTLIITPKHVNVSFTVNEKTYDATTSGSVSPENVTTTDIVPNDVGTVNLVTAHVRVRFFESNVGDAVPVTLSNYYLEGVGYTNYTLDETTVGVGKIVPATVKVEPRLEVEEIDWSENLTQWEISGVRVYFTNFDGVKARDRAYFSVAPDTVALIDPKGGEYAQVNMDTISAVIEPNRNCEKNYVPEIVQPTEPLTIFVRMIEPDEMKDFPRELRMTERTYDSRQHLTNEELRSFIATVDGGKYADLADSFTWVVGDDGLTPVPEASSTSTPRSYFAVYKDPGNPNTTDVQVRIRIPVNARPIMITALPVASIVYGSENPLADAQSELYSVSGLEEGVTLESAFGTLPEVQTNYLQYSPVGSYDITVNTSSLRNVNYSITAVPSSFTVTQRELRTVATATNKAYDGLTDNILVTFSELTGKAREADEVYLPDSVYGTIADPNAGAGKRVTIATPALEGLSKDNYYLVVENLNGLTVTVSKLDPLNYTFPARAVLTYGEPLSEARLEGADGDGVFAFTQPNLIPTDTGVFENLYTMTFTPSNSNYNTVSRRVTVEVEVAQLNIRIVLTGSLYVGNVLTANTQGVPAGALQYLHYSWYRIDPTTGEQTPIGTDSATYTLTNADVGCTLRVTVSIAEGEPYVGSAETVSETILEEVLTFWQRFWRWWQKLFAAIAGLFRR